MRIAFIIYGEIDTLSGGYLYDRRLIDYLRNQGEDVDIISLGIPAYLKALMRNADPQKLLNHSYDLIIQDELAHPACLRLNIELRRKQKIPIIALVHLFSAFIPGMLLTQALRAFVEKRYLMTLDGLILNSQSTLEQAKQLSNKTLPPHLVALPCGDNFSSDIVDEKKYNSGQLKILFVGNLSKQKGLHVLLRSLTLLKEKPISLTVVGREDVERAYVNQQKEFAKKQGIFNKVTFMGVLTGESLRTMYQQHDVFVLPSKNEAYGIVYLEAMQFGLPAIATTMGGGREIIEHKKNGFLVPAEDSIALAEILDKLLQDHGYLAELAKRARERYEAHPQWHQSCENIHDFLKNFQADR
jgi:glycosyltransferase involved in cell wall biosynthesis